MTTGEWSCEADRCGARNEPGALYCEACGSKRPRAATVQPPTPTAEPTTPTCSEPMCRATFTLWTALSTGADGKRRCAGCHVAYLRTVAQSDDPAEREKARADIEQFRRIASSSAWAERFGSKRG